MLLFLLEVLAAKVHEFNVELRDCFNVAENLITRLKNIEPSNSLDLHLGKLQRLIRMPGILNDQYAALKNHFFEVEQRTYFALDLDVEPPKSMDRLSKLCAWLLFPPEFCKFCFKQLVDLYLSWEVMKRIHELFERDEIKEGVLIASGVINACLKRWNTSSDPIFQLVLDKEWWTLFGCNSASLHALEQILLGKQQIKRS